MRAPVRQVSLVAQVSGQFRELIASGQWAVGQRIPGEHELAESLGVSRATVREALRGLSIVGLLEPRIGDGTYVRATDELTGVLSRDETALDHVLDARAALEASGARLAAQHATPAALRELQAALDARTAAHDAGDLIAYAKADAHFHRAVVSASGNPLLIRLYAAVAAVVSESIVHTAVLPEDHAVGQAHQRLAEAIRDKDREAAAAVSYELIDSVKNEVKDVS